MTELSKKARTVGFFYLLLAIVGPVRLIYLVQSFTGVFLPQYADPVSNYSFPFQLGELVFLAWLLIFGAKKSWRAAPV